MKGLVSFLYYHYYSQSLYAVRTLMAQGLSGTYLWDVTRATIMSRIVYASPAWWGMLGEGCRQRLQALLTKIKKQGLLSPTHPTMMELCDAADSRLFAEILHNPHHVLHNLIRAAVPHMGREEGDCPCFCRKQDRLLQLTSVWDDGTCSTSHAGCTECSCSTRCRRWSSRSYHADSSWTPLASYSTTDSVQDGCPRFPLYLSVCPDVSLRDVHIHGRRSWTMSPEVRTPRRGCCTANFHEAIWASQLPLCWPDSLEQFAVRTEGQRNYIVDV